jgi:hypothetical protein
LEKETTVCRLSVLSFFATALQRTEYAEYTSAQERIALGKKSKKLEASKRKDTMQEMIADAYV